MEIKELAKKLHCREYGYELDGINQQELKDQGIVVVFGYSDDNIEFRGAISEEIGAYEGTTINLTSKGLLDNKCEDEQCPYFKEIMDGTKHTIKAIWAKDGYSWTYETKIPHHEFTIMEDGTKYCKGIIFKLSDISD